MDNIYDQQNSSKPINLPRLALLLTCYTVLNVKALFSSDRQPLARTTWQYLWDAKDIEFDHKTHS